MEQVAYGRAAAHTPYSARTDDILLHLELYEKVIGTGAQPLNGSNSLTSQAMGPFAHTYSP